MHHFDDTALRILNHHCCVSAKEREMHYLTQEQQQEIHQLSWDHIDSSINKVCTARQAEREASDENFRQSMRDIPMDDEL